MRISELTDAQFDAITKKVMKLRASGKTWNEVRAALNLNKRDCHIIRGRMIELDGSSVRIVA